MSGPVSPPGGRLVVVGHGMAAARTLEELWALAPGRYHTTVLGAEPQVGYNRVLLSALLSGEVQADTLPLLAPDWYAARGIAVHGDDPVVRIDRSRREVHTARGRVLPYDRLLIATGSKPVKPPLEGMDLPGVRVFRTLADTEALMAASRQFRRAVVIGGGLLGVEAAEGLRRRGMAVTLVHRAPVLLNQQLDAAAGALLADTLRSRGLQLRLSAETEALLGASRVEAVRLASGEVLAADLVVVSIGVRPEIGLAQAAGLHCQRGIVVDDTLQTFDPCIYAVGECVEHRGATFGLVAPVWAQASVCASHLAGEGHRRFEPTQSATRLKVSGIEVYSAGDFAGGDGHEELLLKASRRGVYRRLILRDRRITGAVFFGDTRDSSWFFDQMATGRDVSGLRERLLFGPAWCEAGG